MFEITSLTYKEALDYVASFETSKIKMGLDRIEALLSYMGYPQNYGQNIHVAGTNGKGSVSAFMDAALANKGLFCGRFVSPHLITPRERILVDGQPLSRQWFSAVASYFRDILPKIKEQPSYFELFTAMALYVFRFLKTDVSIIETGLGGRLDSTNLIIPSLCVITSISQDHTSFLGETIESIAIEKAGIIKTGVPVVTSATGRALDVLKMEAIKKSAPLVALDDLEVRESVTDYLEVTVDFRGHSLTGRTQLRGSFQKENMALSLLALHLFTGDTEFSFEGMTWPGRMERFEGHPEIIIDGAHNPSAIDRFIQSVAPVKKGSILLFGCMRDKSAFDMYSALAEHFDTIFLTSGNYHRFMTEKEFNADGRFNSSYVKIESVIEKIKKYPTVYVTGSLHLLGDFIKEMFNDRELSERLIKKAPYSSIFDSDLF